jgi:hypothetical protein
MSIEDTNVDFRFTYEGIEYGFRVKGEHQYTCDIPHSVRVVLPEEDTKLLLNSICDLMEKRKVKLAKKQDAEMYCRREGYR